jgi:flagellar basal body P-ring formation protein FlgA
MYKTYKHFLEAVLISSSLCGVICYAQVSSNSQNLDVVAAKAEQYLQMKYGNQEDTLVKVQTPDDAIDLPECQKMEFSTTANPPTNGNLRVRVQCAHPQVWNIYLSGKVIQKKSYYAARVHLFKGHTITESDLVLNKGFADTLPFNFVSEPQQILGKSVNMDMEAGTPFVGTGLKTENIITTGQNVKIIIGGPGFRINAEGKALNSAPNGQHVQVKMITGQVIQGLARSGGLVEVIR